MSVDYNAELGEYQFWGGFADIVYADGWGDGSGTIYGSSQADVINGADFFPEVDVTDEWDTIYYEGKGGDDELIGGLSQDTARYDSLDWGGWADLGLFDEEGYYIEGSITEFDTRDNGDGSLTVFVNGVDIYTLSLDASGNGFVEDLWPNDGSNGRDTLEAFETIEIFIPHHTMTISVNENGDYEVRGFIRDAVYAEGWGGGGGVLYGSSADDVIIATDPEFDAELGPLEEFNHVEFMASAGNDVMIGHQGSNTFYTEAGDGDDTMDGTVDNRQDSVVYNSYNYDAYAPFRDAGWWQGEVVHQGLVGGSDLYSIQVTDAYGVVTTLYEVAFDPTTLNATVTDTWMADGDTGTDTLKNIDWISFNSEVGYASFEIYDGQIWVDGGDYQPVDIALLDDGAGLMVNDTYEGAVMDANEFGFAGFNDPAMPVIIVGSEYGGDFIVGHDGSNLLEGRGGDDVIDGRGGVDTALFATDYYSYDYENGGVIDPVVTWSFDTVENVLTVGTQEIGDIWSVDLDATRAVDTIGDTVFDASYALEAGKAVASSFESATDKDVFAVYLEAGQTYQMGAQSNDANENGTEAWIDQVTDEYGNWPNGDLYNDGYGGYTFTPYESGTYYLHVASEYQAPGDYAVAVLPMGQVEPSEVVSVPSDYQPAITVQDVSWNDQYDSGLDYLMNVENLEFQMVAQNGSTGSGASLELQENGTGYDIVVNGVQEDSITLA